MFYFSQLLGTCVTDYFINCVDSLTEVLLLAETLSFQNLSFNISSGLISFPFREVIVSTFDILSSVESIYGVIVVVLSHKSLGKGDVHVNLE